MGLCELVDAVFGPPVVGGLALACSLVRSWSAGRVVAWCFVVLISVAFPLSALQAVCC